MRREVDKHRVWHLEGSGEGITFPGGAITSFLCACVFHRLQLQVPHLGVCMRGSGVGGRAQAQLPEGLSASSLHAGALSAVPHRTLPR